MFDVNMLSGCGKIPNLMECNQCANKQNKVIGLGFIGFPDNKERAFSVVCGTLIETHGRVSLSESHFSPFHLPCLPCLPCLPRLPCLPAGRRQAGGRQAAGRRQADFGELPEMKSGQVVPPMREGVEGGFPLSSFLLLHILQILKQLIIG